jgi:P4 family phage/plasmid primase-like protien
MNFAEQFEIYKQNIFPAMLEVLAEDLGCKVTSLQQLEVGFYPAKQAWVFAERDAKGEIIGLQLRFKDGKKLMESGSKRGLIYPYNENALEGEKRYEPGRCHWTRLQEAGIDCPICGKPDWCMVSSDNPSDPSAVLCSRISEGCLREIGESGYLHLLRQQPDGQRSSILLGSDTPQPVVIVEGASDVLATLDLGFTAIGRPSAKGGMEELKKMPLTGREIWIIGENDAGAGKQGMDKTFLNLEHLSDNILCVMPPESMKDLRQWTGYGLTQEDLIAYVGKSGQAGIRDPNIFPDDIAQTIAKLFLEKFKDDNGILTLRSYRGKWTEWHNGRHEIMEYDVFRGKLYTFLKGKQFIRETKTGVDVTPYKPTRAKVNDIIDALSCWCPVFGVPPVWINRKDRPLVKDLLAFENGLLDINEYCKGNIVLLDPTPDLFTFATLPYSYDPEAWSNLLDEYCDMTFNNDDDIIKLLSQWFGYNLVYDTTFEKLMMFVGQRRSGKSTILSAMEAMLGSEQCGSTSLSMLANPFGLGSLVGKSTVIAGDIKGTLRKAEMDAALEIILRITGRDRVPINQKYLAPYDAELSCRFTMAMNDLPLFTDHSRAIVARTLILPFPNCYEGREDFTLKDRIRKEATQGKLINFALQGLKDLREQGRFVEPEASTYQLMQFKELTSPMSAFLEECCIIGDDLNIEKDQIYEAWKAWCAACDRKAGNKILFGRWLTQHAPMVKTSQKRDAGGNRMYAFKGVTLKPWVFVKYLGRPY